MTHCHECNSEVADTDTFCPYCGITLVPVSIPSDPAEDAMASTIVMSSPAKPLKPEKLAAAEASLSPAAAPEAEQAPDTLPAAGTEAKAPPEVAPGETAVAAGSAELASEPEMADAAAAEQPATLPEIVEEAVITESPGDEPISAAGSEDDELVEEPVLPASPSDTVTSEHLGPTLEQVEVPFSFGEETSVENEAREAIPDVEIATAETVESLAESADVAEGVSEPIAPEPIDFAELPDGSDAEAAERAFLKDIDDEDVDDQIASSADEAEPSFSAVSEPSAEITDTVLADRPEPFHEVEAIETTPADDGTVGMTPKQPDSEMSAVVIEEVSFSPTPAAEASVEETADADEEPQASEPGEHPVVMPELLSDAYAGAELIEPPVGSTVTAVNDEPGSAPAQTSEPVELGEPLEQTDSGRVASDSGTTPNIGTGSTDGRKSGLKPLAEGTLLNGRYRISKKIGGGGMGAVYLAFDQNLGNTQRAVKEMVQSHIEEDQQAKAIEDFKRESMILSTLDHPSIPTIYDYFYDESESRFYLVMKYISGGDLAARLRSAPEGRIDEKTVTEWAIEIIDVLDYLHSLPTTIVYRDLKPSNVMIDGNTGRIMLIDFGIARSINQSEGKGVTAVGTMGYAPPELFSGQVEPRSDIYSLGSTMFHLLTGADPQNNPLLIFDFQKNPRPRQINPRLSDQMEQILMRAVEYNADARFSSAAEMRRALQKHLESLGSGTVSFGISESPAAVSLANQTVFCGFCGQRIVATDLFCAFCGSKQPLAQQGVHSEIYARGNVTARLVIEGTSDLTAPAYALEKNDNLVGRRDPMSNIFPEVDLSKYDPQTKISRRHARIWRDGSNFLVEDLGSSNGTLLLSRVSDALRLPPHMPHPLTSGDRLKIGDTTLQFIVG